MSAEPAVVERPKIDASATFRRIALPHLDHVYTSALYLTRNGDLAEDLTQETFLRAFRFFHRFEPGTNCRAWLLTILHNLFRNQYRRNQRQGYTVDVDDPESAAEARAAVEPVDDPADLFVSGAVDDEVRAALEGLPEEFRSVVVLVDLQELTYAEAAKVAGCPVGTVRSRLSRGRTLLAQRLEEYAVRTGYLRRKKAE